MQAILQSVRSTIRRAVPGTQEMISDKIPSHKLPNGTALWFAGWKQRYSLYPAADHVVEALKSGLAPHKVSKGTIRFPLSQPAPVKLIERIAKFRAKEVATRGTIEAKLRAKPPSRVP